MTKKTPLRALRTLTRLMTLAVFGLIVYVLLHFFPGGGWGTGQGTSEPSGGAKSRSNETLVSNSGNDANFRSALHDTIAREEEPASTHDSRTATNMERAALASGVLTILIDEHNYFLASPEGDGWSYSPLTLARATDLSTQAAGDSNGIRVRILRRPTSRASAEHRLMNELQNAGLEPDAIFMSSQLEPAK